MRKAMAIESGLLNLLALLRLRRVPRRRPKAATGGWDMELDTLGGAITPTRTEALNLARKPKPQAASAPVQRKVVQQKAPQQAPAARQDAAVQRAPAARQETPARSTPRVAARGKDDSGRQAPHADYLA